MCVCVCVKERDTQRDRERETYGGVRACLSVWLSGCVCVCACDCVCVFVCICVCDPVKLECVCVLPTVKSAYKLTPAYCIFISYFSSNAGVHLVACIGRVQASFKWCLTGSFVGDLWLKFNPSTTETSCLLSATAVNLFGISWKPPVRPYRSKRARFFVLFVCGTIYLLLWTTSVYFNVIANDVETVPLKRVIDAYFTSAVWPVVRERIHRAWHHLNDWWLRFRRIEELIPPDGGSPHEV